MIQISSALKNSPLMRAAILSDERGTALEEMRLAYQKVGVLWGKGRGAELRRASNNYRRLHDQYLSSWSCHSFRLSPEELDYINSPHKPNWNPGRDQMDRFMEICP